jgi:hypothetical protein
MQQELAQRQRHGPQRVQWLRLQLLRPRRHHPAPLLLVLLLCLW